LLDTEKLKEKKKLQLRSLGFAGQRADVPSGKHCWMLRSSVGTSLGGGQPEEQRVQGAKKRRMIF